MSAPSLALSPNSRLSYRESRCLFTKLGKSVNMLILVVDDEPDVEALFRQQFGANSALVASPWNLRDRPRWRFNVLLMLAMSPSLFYPTSTCRG